MQSSWENSQFEMEIDIHECPRRTSILAGWDQKSSSIVILYIYEKLRIVYA